MKSYKKVPLAAIEKIEESSEVCIICGGYTDLKSFKGKKVCRKCILGVK